MNIKISSEDELAEKFKESVHILNNLRHSTKEWKERYGSGFRRAKEYWENKADAFLNRLDATPTRKKEQVKIINSNT